MTERNDELPQNEIESAFLIPAFSEPPRHPSASAAVSAICGIVACVFNLFVITSVLGVIFAIAALVFGLVAMMTSRQGQAGLVLTGISFFILLVWIASIVFPMLLDPTLTLDIPKLK
jgi:cytochrome bd-type quinol oxidase subunit 2